MTKLKENSCVSDNKVSTLVSTPYLDTLAQLDQNAPPRPLEVLRKRASAKFYGNVILAPLIDLNSPLKKAYWNTFHCVQVLIQHRSGAFTSKYCKNRFCIVCNRIRTGTMVNRYGTQLAEQDCLFITLTTHLTKTCFTKEALNKTIKRMKDTFKLIYRKAVRKFGSVSLIRKLEITYHETKTHFHPHFHIITENNSECAEFMVSQWLSYFTNSRKSAQDVRVADKNTIIELFKYTTKMWTKVDADNYVLPYPAEKLDTIFSVLHKQRTFEVYGKKFRHIHDDFTPDEATVILEDMIPNETLWLWEQECRTWVEMDTGELLT